jgi:hypothetical protein
MSPRLAVDASPLPLEAFAARFDDLLSRRSQNTSAFAATWKACS